MPPARRSLDIVYPQQELQKQVWLQLLRTVHSNSRKFEIALAGVNLTLPQFDLLATLSARQGITQQQLAENLLVTKGNICGMADRLESAGLIERRADPDDRRANRLYLTRAGQAALRSASPAHDRLLAGAFSALDRSQQLSLLKLLELMDASSHD